MWEEKKKERERERKSKAVTFGVQEFGRIEVEVPAEKGDEVRGHRSPPRPSSLETLATAEVLDVLDLFFFFLLFWWEFPTPSPASQVWGAKLSADKQWRPVCWLAPGAAVKLANLPPLGPPTTYRRRVLVCPRGAHGWEPRPHGVTQRSRTTRWLIGVARISKVFFLSFFLSPPTRAHRRLATTVLPRYVNTLKKRKRKKFEYKQNDYNLELFCRVGAAGKL